MDWVGRDGVDRNRGLRLEVTLWGYIWGTLELKAMVGQLCLNNSCAAHLFGHEIHHKSCVIAHLLGYTYLWLPPKRNNQDWNMCFTNCDNHANEITIARTFAPLRYLLLEIFFTRYFEKLAWENCWEKLALRNLRLKLDWETCVWNLIEKLVTW